ncbi:MAG: phenylalanine 4-monooxygenase, partial [Myroides sp.]
TVTHNDTILFQPEWGTYDMAVGKKIVSAFSGPADINSFDMITHVPTTKTIKAIKSTEREALENLYEKIRSYREQNSTEDLEVILSDLIQNHPQDWLLTLEIVELAKQNNLAVYNKALDHLLKVKANRPEIAHLVANGLNLL